MHFLKGLAAITALCAFLTTSVASPAPAANASPDKNVLKTKKAEANVAVVNVYSSYTCGSSSTSFTVTGGSVCHAVSDANSIEVSEQYVCSLIFTCDFFRCLLVMLQLTIS